MSRLQSPTKGWIKTLPCRLGISGYYQVPVLEYPGLELTKGSRCESHLDVIVNSACWGQDTADVGEVRYNFELLTIDV